MNQLTSITARLRSLVDQVKADEAHFGVLSHGEKIAVALALDRIDLLKREGIHTLESAKDRVGPEWVAAARACKRVEPT